jgi:hypothetical protein
MSDTDTDTGEYLSVEQFEEYLQTTFAASTNEEVLYLRTNVVADELGLSRQQVGQLFIRHKSRSQTFDIERRSKSNRAGQGSKWKLVRDESREPDAIAMAATPAKRDGITLLTVVRPRIRPVLTIRSNPPIPNFCCFGVIRWIWVTHTEKNHHLVQSRSIVHESRAVSCCRQNILIRKSMDEFSGVALSSHQASICAYSH